MLEEVRESPLPDVARFVVIVRCERHQELLQARMGAEGHSHERRDRDRQAEATEDKSGCPLNAIQVLTMTTGFTAGAARKNATLNGTGAPFASRRRVAGTLPHSQTGRQKRPIVAPSRAARTSERRVKRCNQGGETTSWIVAEATTPSRRNDSVSMKLPRKIVANS